MRNGNTIKWIAELFRNQHYKIIWLSSSVKVSMNPRIAYSAIAPVLISIHTKCNIFINTCTKFVSSYFSGELSSELCAEWISKWTRNCWNNQMRSRVEVEASKQKIMPENVLCLSSGWIFFQRWNTALSSFTLNK